MHDRMAEVGACLRKVVPGYYQYHAVPGNTTQSRIFKLRVCAALAAVSRGTVEAEYAGEEFGLERMKQSLQHATARSAHGLCLDLLQSVQNFTRSPATHNDVTALALVRNVD
jgi:hypothetical protein